MFFGEPFGGVLPGARGAVLAVLLRTGEPLTGRQVHGLLSDEHSLWSVQEALRAWVRLGVVEARSVGRARVHTVNGAHAAVASLRLLADPVALLAGIVGERVDPTVQAVILYGSIARGEARPDSDIDLAVIAGSVWDRRVELQEAVRAGLGNECDVLVFTPARFRRLAASGEPVVSDILRDGIALFGSVPRVRRGVA
jgi:predicted nucleotidyltransferase